jgi:hypothetical protein
LTQHLVLDLDQIAGIEEALALKPRSLNSLRMAVQSTAFCPETESTQFTQLRGDNS